MLHNSLHNAVIGIGALVIALETFPALIASNAQRDAVFGTEFFQLGHDAGCDDRGGFGVEQVHESLIDFKLVGNGVREEIGVDENGVGRSKSGVGLEEEGRGDLWATIRLE